MRRALATLAGASLAALLSTTASAQSVTYDYDRATNFASLKTYTWVRGHELSDDLNHKRIVDAIDAQLAARGMVKVEPGANPDVLVAYHVSFGRELEINGYSSGWGGYRAGPRTGSARVEEVVVGALAVDLIDAKTKSILYRGIATKEVDTKASPEKRDRNINRAAEKLFKELPSGSRSGTGGARVG
jgi:hypothetical protein